MDLGQILSMLGNGLSKSAGGGDDEQMSFGGMRQQRQVRNPMAGMEPSGGGLDPRLAQIMMMLRSGMGGGGMAGANPLSGFGGGPGGGFGANMLGRLGG